MTPAAASDAVAARTVAVWEARARALDVPDHDGWLTPAERAVRSSLRPGPRRSDWLLGRWVAKRAVARALAKSSGPVDVSRVEVMAAVDGAPEIRRSPKTIGAISLSHRAGHGFAVARLEGATLGCDVELVEPRTARFVQDYFTPAERDLAAAAGAAERDLVVNLVWSAKESALKALRCGLRADTRSVEVCLPSLRSAVSKPEAWHPMTVRLRDGGRLRGCWSHSDGFIRTVVADGHPSLVRQPGGGV